MNDFKNKFNELIDKKVESNYEFFTKSNCDINNQKWVYYKFNYDSEILQNAVELATTKSNFTMDYNQNARKRASDEKIKKSAQGILGEIAIQLFFKEILNIEVKRFDLERTSFEYSSKEYDLKYGNENNEKFIEVRTSNAHNTRICKFIETDVIIGPYISTMKHTDKIVDLHFRPVYFPSFDKEGENNFDLIIFGCASKEEMQKLSFESNLGQENALYRVIKIVKCGDADEIIKKI